MADFETSTFEKIPYPGVDNNLFMDAFRAFVQEVDLRLRSLRIQQSLSVAGGGTVTWNGTQLAWTSDFEVDSPVLGFRHYLRYGPNGTQRVANMSEGDYLVAPLAPALVENRIENFSVTSTASNLPAGDWVVGYVKNGQFVSQWIST